MKAVLVCVIIVFATLSTAQAAPLSATYAYDGRGRLASVTYSDGKTVTYTYDAAGNRVKETVSVPTVTAREIDAPWNTQQAAK